jgi:hypothetical protein
MSTEAKAERIPPYTSYKTFRTLIDDLRTHGVPSHVDRDVLKRFSGSVGTQLVTALRFLKLINDANEPLATLDALVDAKEDAQWKAALLTALKAAYGDLMAMDLKRATPMALSKEFKERYTNKDDVVKKCVRFFVHAVKDAGVELSPRIVNATRERRKPTTPRTKKRAENGDSEENGADNGKKDSDKSRVSSGEKTNYQMLIDILSPDMEQAEQDAIWTLIRYLKKAETED